jgi:arylsulfatase A-like enzyme
VLLGAGLFSACAEPEPAALPTVKRLDFGVEWRMAEGASVHRRVAREPLPSRLSQSVVVPSGGVLHWKYAARDWRAPRAVEVTISVLDGRHEETLFEDQIRASRREPRVWQEGQLDLSHWAGREIELIFEAHYAEPVRNVREAQSVKKGTGRMYWSAPHIAPGAEVGERAPSVILVLVDTLRADRLGVYGGERDLTPNLDRLAARGTLFENAFSQTNWTLPAIATIMTGLYPSRHGVVEHDKGLRSHEGNMARVFGRNDYLSIGYHDGGYAEGRFGFADGFDEYRRIRHLSDFSHVTEWMGKHRDRPFLLFLHTYDVHAPYATVPEEFHSLFVDPEFVDDEELARAKPGQIKRELSAEELQYFSDLYDGEIRYADERLGELLAIVERLGMSENTLILVTSDHGEEFGDHGGVEHGTGNLHGELTQVPLIVAGPGVAAGKRVQRPVQLADLLPTMADLLGFGELDPAGLDGRSFASSLQADEVESPGNGVDLGSVAWSEQVGRFALRTVRWTLIGDHEGALALYDRIEDPGEQQDVAAENREVVEEHKELLRLLMSRETTGSRADETEIDQDLRKQLEALGYLN